MRIPCREEDVRGDFITHVLPEHKIARDGDDDVEGVSKDKSVVDGAGVLGGVAHVAVDVGKDGMPAPRGHEEAEGEREVGPVLRPEWR